MCRRFEQFGRSEVRVLAGEVAAALAELAEHNSDVPRALAQLDPLTEWRATLARPTSGPSPSREAFPGSVVALIAPTGAGSQLAVADLVWGFEAPWHKGPLFNTRIETALERPDSLWAQALATRRCVVPARAFYEAHGTETVTSARTGRPIKRQYAFERPDGSALWLAGIHESGRFSLITVPPRGAVIGVHDRMPLALSARDAARWLAGDIAGARAAALDDLSAHPEQPASGDPPHNA